MAKKNLKRKARVIAACLMTYLLTISFAIEKIEVPEIKRYIVLFGIIVPICTFVVYKAVLSYLEVFEKSK